MGLVTGSAWSPASYRKGFGYGEVGALFLVRNLQELRE